MLGSICQGSIWVHNFDPQPYTHQQDFAICKVGYWGLRVAQAMDAKVDLHSGQNGAEPLLFDRLPTKPVKLEGSILSVGPTALDAPPAGQTRATFLLPERA